ncbi:MAG: AI-2E family transporter [Eubacteriales bacterium]|nr:AI-2E family transporter [Eubacteriales bacterium]
MNNTPETHQTSEAPDRTVSSRSTAEERFAAFREDKDPLMEAERRQDRERRKKIHDFLRTDYAKISLYVILTFLVIYLIIKVGDHFPRILSSIAGGAAGLLVFLRPLIWGLGIAYLLYPLMKFFERKLNLIGPYRSGRLKARTPATALTLLLALAVIVLLLSLVFSTVSHQARMIRFDDLGTLITSLASSLSEMYRAMQRRLTEANISSDVLNDLAQSTTNWVGKLTGILRSSLTGSLTNMTGILTNALFAVIFAIYFLLDTDRLKSYWDRVLRSVTDQWTYKGIHLFLQDVDNVFSGYIRGQIIDAVLMAVMVSVALSIVGVRFAILIGIMTGIGNLVPYVGPFIAYGSTILICLINGDIKRLVISLIILFIIQTIDGNVINPKLLSASIDVHPMMVILALTAGSAIGGLLGMLLAVPVAALIKIWFDRIITILLEHKTKKRADS